MQKLILQVIVALLGLLLAIKLVPGVKFVGPTEVFFFCGLVLGLINFFIKPLLRKITFPIRFLTLGLFGFVINMGILWFLNILFPGLEILGIWSFFLTACVISVLNLLLKAVT